MKLKESDLKKIITESIMSVLNEGEEKININKTYTSKKGFKHCVEINLYSQDQNSDILDGDFEYYVDDFEDDTYVSGNINIENGEVIDFDGCFDLPKAVKKALKENGYTINW